jgi:hypothetical protein|tara:strand:- start:559 stop:870 length:312 start_codon:yes stop_codon:yes gene_type:complete
MTEYTDKQLAEMDKEAKDNIAINSGVKTKNKPMTIQEEYKNADVPIPPKVLGEIIQVLETRNDYLHKHIEKLTNEILDIRKDNKKLSKQCEDQMDQFRNKGVL